MLSVIINIDTLLPSDRFNITIRTFDCVNRRNKYVNDITSLCLDEMNKIGYQNTSLETFYGSEMTARRNNVISTVRSVKSIYVGFLNHSGEYKMRKGEGETRSRHWPIIFEKQQEDLQAFRHHSADESLSRVLRRNLEFNPGILERETLAINSTAEEFGI